MHALFCRNFQPYAWQYQLICMRRLSHRHIVVTCRVCIFVIVFAVPARVLLWRVWRYAVHVLSRGKCIVRVGCVIRFFLRQMRPW